MAELDRKVVQEFWEERANQADDPRSVTLDRSTPRSVQSEVDLYRRWLMRELEREKIEPRSVADLGCGNGDWTIPLAQSAERIFATDIADGFVAHVEARLRAEAPRCAATVRQADIATVELPGTFDLIVLGSVTQYVEDDEVDALLRRFRSSLGPRGVLYLRTTISRGERRARSDDTYGAIYRPIDWYRDHLARTGYVITNQSTATDFVATEWCRRSFGRALYPVLGIPTSFALRQVRRLYRSRRPSDVMVCLARPA